MLWGGSPPYHYTSNPFNKEKMLCRFISSKYLWPCTPHKCPNRITGYEWRSFLPSLCQSELVLSVFQNFVGRPTIMDRQTRPHSTTNIWAETNHYWVIIAHSRNDINFFLRFASSIYARVSPNLKLKSVIKWPEVDITCSICNLFVYMLLQDVSYRPACRCDLDSMAAFTYYAAGDFFNQ